MAFVTDRGREKAVSRSEQVMLTQKQEILASFDEVWSHKWESIDAVLKDMTDDEARFVHPIYLGIEREEGFPSNGSILWHLTHLAFCYRHYSEGLRAMPAKPADTSGHEPASVEDAIEDLKRSRQTLREEIAGLADSSLDQKVWFGDTVAQFIRMIIRHDAWHSAQIAVARRLYKMR
jgi:uncharacterized damage-inducible protein DinB